MAYNELGRCQVALLLRWLHRNEKGSARRPVALWRGSEATRQAERARRCRGRAGWRRGWRRGGVWQSDLAGGYVHGMQHEIGESLPIDARMESRVSRGHVTVKGFPDNSVNGVLPPGIGADQVPDRTVDS